VLPVHISCISTDFALSPIIRIGSVTYLSLVSSVVPKFSQQEPLQAEEIKASREALWWPDSKHQKRFVHSVQ
jgi:hypothetical protein